MKTLEKKQKMAAVYSLCVIFLSACDFSFNAGREDEEPEVKDDVSLASRYAGSFLMGNVASPSDLGTARFELLKKHFNVLTAENAMKPEALAPAAKGGAYKWTAADRVAQAALDAGMKLHGHTLVWHQQTPAWLYADGENLAAYVTEAAAHFKGKVISWDVVNEAIRDNAPDPADWKSSLRDEPAGNSWLAALGSGYVEEAFRAARAADSEAKLYYNDYNLDNEAKAKTVYAMVKEINANNGNVGGRPLIDGIGMQAHYSVFTDPAKVEASIKLFASLGVEVAISELDVQAVFAGSTQGFSEWNDTVARKQAEQYAALFNVFSRNAASVSRVTFWGIDDASSWRSANKPCLFEKQGSEYAAKPAFYAVVNPADYL